MTELEKAKLDLKIFKLAFKAHTRTGENLKEMFEGIKEMVYN